jgi:hypothetical protein
MSMKKFPMTPSEIEPATFRLVAQCLKPTAPLRIDQNCGHVAGEELGFLLVCSTVTRGHEKMLGHVSRLPTTCDWASIKKKGVEPLNNPNLSSFIKSVQCMEQRLVMESRVMVLYYSAYMCTTCGYVVISS